MKAFEIPNVFDKPSPHQVDCGSLEMLTTQLNSCFYSPPPFFSLKIDFPTRTNYINMYVLHNQTPKMYFQRI